MTQDRSATDVGTDESAQDVKVVVWRLDRELKAAMRFGAKSNRQLHSVMLKDLRRAERRADQAEKRARAAERQARRAEERAERLERELAEVRRSATWRAGRAVVALPARIKRWRTS